MRRGGRERQGEDEQAERQGHGMAGVNEAEAKGQTGGHEKGPGLPPRQRDHGGGQEAGSMAGRRRLLSEGQGHHLPHIPPRALGEESGIDVWDISPNCWSKAAAIQRLWVRLLGCGGWIRRSVERKTAKNRKTPSEPCRPVPRPVSVEHVPPTKVDGRREHNGEELTYVFRAGALKKYGGRARQLLQKGLPSRAVCGHRLTD